MFKVTQSTSAVSIHVKNMDAEADKIFHVDLEAQFLGQPIDRT